MSEVTYKLVVFARDVDIYLGTMNPRHTGYALVKFENNEAVSMKTVEISGNILPPVMSLIQSETSDVALEGGWLPMTLDLDGDGVETVSVNDGVYFDHDGNGFAEKSGWVSKDDAILVRDLNNNGQIDDGSELFGDQTILSDGTEAANGFEALAA